MIFVVTFYFVMLTPGMSAPLIYEEKVATIEECIGMVADYELRVRAIGKTGGFQAGCKVEIPQIESH